ncbi:acyltransferase family protein [Patescibacteria group bacterium]
MQNATAKSKRILSFDLLRGWAILLILLYHIFLFFLDKNILSKPTGYIENFSRFKSLLGYFLASGYQGVHLFLIISGFLLTLSTSKKNYSLLDFYKKRLKRILVPFYPVWLLSIILIFLAATLPFFKNFNTFLKLDVALKTLFFPLYFDFRSSVLSQVNRAWWFLPLILELYIIFPFLSTIQKKVSTNTFIILTFLVTIHYRLLATFLLKGSPIGVVAATSGGSIPFIFFPARLFEFCLGMSLARIYLKDQSMFKKLSSPFHFFMGFLFQLVGTVATFYQPFWIVSDPLIAIGMFLLGINIVSMLRKVKPLAKALVSLGNLSYPLYLIHYLLLIKFLLPFLKLEYGKIIYLSFLPLYFAILIGLSKIVQAVDKKFN